MSSSFEKRMRRKFREQERKLEKLEALNRQAEKMIQIREQQAEKSKILAQVAMNYIYALAERLGGDSIILTYEELNDPKEYLAQQTETGIVLSRVNTEK